MGERLGERRVVPDDDAALRAAERLARRTGQHGRALAQRILELAAGDQAELVRAVEEDPPAPLRDDLGSSRATGNGNSVIDAPSATSFGRTARATVAERVEVDLQLHRVEWDVDDLQPAHAGRAVSAVARMAAEGWGIAMIMSPGSVSAA